MSVQKLIQTLDALSVIHSRLLELGEQKKKYIIKNDIDALMKCANTESRLIKEIAEIEKQRIHATNYILLERGLKLNPHITVSELAKIVTNINDKQSLIAASGQLSELLLRLKEINELNQQLISQSLQFIDYSLDLIGGSDDDIIYHNSKQQSTLNKRSLFDTKA
ncbi:flagellar protein FlgN [Paenibacillus sp. CGMCC 1.16610]|uniref:Flagellar protein FlgN n=1 Tax=Paenibacillus anseongense TaxID=2682845 RepID=A0ABW9U4X6_9BACL|nr:MULTISPECIES: flagellar protein FlgN [Paenibacillus]MBA2942411.1 flagellar protein FlgN [Paenibacillus sp. CGMCC 1.16610]MVQ34486.1 flagellar protein FlgN [Paenibacillus anseongense]